MSDDNDIVRDRQQLIRREMERRGMLLKQVQLDGGWETVSTVSSYFPANEETQPAVMSVGALHRLIRTKALPVDLLSLLLPNGFAIVQVPENIDHDALADAMRDYLRAKDHAHHPDSPAGRDIAPCEDLKLSTQVVQLRARAA
jgi:trans-aconitate methyltransferase